MPNLKSITFKKILCTSFLLMFALASLWIFQTNDFSASSDKVIEAQGRLSNLRRTGLGQFGYNIDYSIEQLAQNLAFEKIESVHYIKVDISTALAK